MEPYPNSHRTFEPSSLQLTKTNARQANDFEKGEDEELVKPTSNTGRPRRLVCLVIGFACLAVAAAIVVVALNNADFEWPSPLKDDADTTVVMNLEEVGEHASADDCWTVFHGFVYDMTSYEHPGGFKEIQPACGIEGSVIYQSYHRRRLLKMIVNFKVGVFDEGAEG